MTGFRAVFLLESGELRFGMLLASTPHVPADEAPDAIVPAMMLLLNA